MWKSDQSPFFHRAVFSFCIWQARQVLKTFSERYWKNAFIKTHWMSLEQTWTNWWFFEKVIFPKIGWSWLKFGFQLPKDMGLEPIRKHSSFSEPISKHSIGIWLRIHFSGQRLMHRLPSTIIFPKMLRWKCQFENLAEIYKILLFTHFYALLN